MPDDPCLSALSTGQVAAQVLRPQSAPGWKKDFASYKPRANSNGDLVPLDVEEVLFEEVYTFSVL